MEKKIEFKDLSGWLKAAVVSSWIIGGLFAVAIVFEFCVGMLYGMSA